MAYFCPLTGVRSITSICESGALHMGRFQQSWNKHISASVDTNITATSLALRRGVAQEDTYMYSVEASPGVEILIVLPDRGIALQQNLSSLKSTEHPGNTWGYFRRMDCLLCKVCKAI